MSFLTTNPKGSKVLISTTIFIYLLRVLFNIVYCVC